MVPYDKLSPEVVKLLDAEDSEGFAGISAFISTHGELTPEQERSLEALGVRIRTRAGDVVTCDIPVSVIGAVAKLPFIRFIEGSRRLYSEKD